MPVNVDTGLMTKMTSDLDGNIKMEMSSGRETTFSG